MIKGRMRQRIEDFKVEEIPKDRPIEEGESTIFWMKKFNWDTNKAVKMIANRLHVSMSRVGMAGTKDKRAVTAQRISVWNVPKEKIEGLRFKDIELYGFTTGDRLNLGDLEGNKFEITVRDVDMTEKELVKELEKRIAAMKKGIKNYFGPQRFGEVRPNTHLVGMELMKGNFEEAVKIYIARAFEKEPEDARTARDFITKNWGKKDAYLKALDMFPRRLSYERTMLDYLHNYPTDFAGAIRKLPKNLRKMFLNAVQAWVWNETAERLELEDIELPLVYYDSKLDPKKKTDKIILDVLKKNKIDIKGFKMPNMPELECTGGNRKLMLVPKHLKLIDVSKDEFNEGKLKFTVSFSLPSGCYASIVMTELMR